MKPFRVFLSHCDQDGRPFVRRLYELLEEAFMAEIEAQSLKIYFDEEDGVRAGDELRPALAKQIRESDLVLACFFRRWPQASFFQQEIKEAFKTPVQIVPVLFLKPGEDPAYFRLGDLDPRLEEQGGGRLVHAAVLVRVGEEPNAGPIGETIRAQVGLVLGGTLIKAIRSAIISRARRDLTMFDSSDELLHDLAANDTTCIDMFMYDGGTTIRRLSANAELIEHIHRSTSLRMRFLYVDTDFRPFVCETSEFEGTPELKQLGENIYAPLYEALLRKSGMVHNESPKGHMYDVSKSVEALRALAKDLGFSLEVRKTCQLPFYRMVITRRYAYYTHFLPTFQRAHWGDGSPEYHTLRLAVNSPAGSSLVKHFESLWENAKPHLDPSSRHSG